MGSKQSTIVASASTTQSSSMPKHGNGCLSSRSKFFQLLDKLRRTIKRHLTLRTRKRRCCFQRTFGPRTALLRPMPRCSSYGSCSTLLTPTTRRHSKKKTTVADTHYAEWKCMFEHADKDSATTAQRPHDMSEALTGQTTPRGFPSHTDTRRCPPPSRHSTSYNRLTNEIQIRRRLSFRLPGSNQGSIRRLTPRQRAIQAKLDAQLQRDLSDLEEYYGFHYTRRNERPI